MGIFDSNDEVYLENANIDCEPQNEYVTEENVAKIDDVLDPGENVHYLAAEAGGGIEIKGREVEGEQKAGTMGHIRTAATNKRVVSKVPQFFKSEEISIPYETISSVGIRSGMVQTKFTIETNSQTYSIGIGQLADDACSSMVGFVRKMSSEAVESPSKENHSESGPLEQIERLQELNKRGAITDDEFEEKKKDLLENL